MVLGGQHFLGALLKMRMKYLSISGVNEGDLPEAYRVVHTLVLRVDAPWSACRSAAGAHQAMQHDSVESSVADMMSVLLEMITEKSQKFNSIFLTLTDEELWGALQAMGVVRGSREVLKKSKADMSQDEALEYEKKQVYFSPCDGCCQIPMTTCVLSIV